MVEVVGSDEFAEWFQSLSDSDTDAVARVVDYAFDPVRQAVLLIGGDKTGDGRFYERMIPLSERIWARYLKESGR